MKYARAHKSKKNKEPSHKAWAKIVAKAWSDEVFKQRLLNNPNGVFEEHGIEPLSGVTYQVHQNTSSLIHISLPMKPIEPISEEEIMNLEQDRPFPFMGPVSCKSNLE